jgi:hypothetical protein
MAIRITKNHVPNRSEGWSTPLSAPRPHRSHHHDHLSSLVRYCLLPAAAPLPPTPGSLIIRVARRSDGPGGLRGGRGHDYVAGSLGLRLK